jgi:hypothetical protein
VLVTFGNQQIIIICFYKGLRMGRNPSILPVGKMDKKQNSKDKQTSLFLLSLYVFFMPKKHIFRISLCLSSHNQENKGARRPQ